MCHDLLTKKYFQDITLLSRKRLHIFLQAKEKEPVFEGRGAFFEGGKIFLITNALKLRQKTKKHFTSRGTWLHLPRTLITLLPSLSSHAKGKQPALQLFQLSSCGSGWTRFPFSSACLLDFVLLAPAVQNLAPLPGSTKAPMLEL